MLLLGKTRESPYLLLINLFTLYLSSIRCTQNISLYVTAQLAITVCSVKLFRSECLFNEIYFYKAEARKRKKVDTDKQ